jgi:type IV pilus assembly protein PilV
MSGKDMRSSKRKMAGFGLLEILIAFIILLVGLLGMAGLQATALRNNNSAYLRSQAVILAHDILDRMRANKVAALAGDYARDFDDPIPTKSCTSSSCSTADMASSDEREWMNALSNLPSGDGSIAVDNVGNATVIICWDDARIDDGSDADGECSLTQFQMTTRL